MAKSSQEKLRKLIFSNHPLYEEAGEYIISKDFVKEYTSNPFKAHEGRRDNPEILLDRERRKFKKCEQDLEAKREDAKQKRTELDKQWEELREKEMKFRDTFFYFHKFIKENSDKRQRVISKTIESEKSRQVNEKLIAEAKKDIFQVKSVIESLQEKINSFKIYEDFLKKVVDKYIEFKNVNDVLLRYELLKSKRIEVTQRQENILKSIENAQSTLAENAKEKYERVLQSKGYSTNLYQRFAKARDQNLSLERLCLKLRQECRERMEMVVSVLQSCNNMYKYLMEEKGLKSDFVKTNIEDRIIVIKKTLKEYPLALKLLETKYPTSITTLNLHLNESH